MAGTERRKRRWGDTAATSTSDRSDKSKRSNGVNELNESESLSKTGEGGAEERKGVRRSRFSASPPSIDTGNGNTNTHINNNNNQKNNNDNDDLKKVMDGKAKAAALQQSISARLAALKAKKAALSSSAASLAASRSVVTNGLDKEKGLATNTNSLDLDKVKKRSVEESGVGVGVGVGGSMLKKAKVYDLDMSVTTPLFRQKQSNSKPSSSLTAATERVNPYLAHRQAVPVSVPSVSDSAASSSAAVTLLSKADMAKTMTMTSSNSTPSNSNSNSNSNSTPSNTIDAMDTMDTSVPSEMEVLLDERLAGGQVAKARSRNKQLRFVEPGTFIQIAQRKRERAANAAKSGFVSGRKQGTFIQSKGFVTPYYGTTSTDTSTDTCTATDSLILPPRPDAPHALIPNLNLPIIPMPLVMEWWDVELLPTKLKKDVVSKEGHALAKLAKNRIHQIDNNTTTTNTTNHANPTHPSHDSTNNDNDNNNNNDNQQEKEAQTIKKLAQKCFITASITNSKTSSLVQHPVPVQPPNLTSSTTNHNNNNNTPTAPTLHLTKKEMKRQRKLRRAERQRELQDMQAAGLLPPPEPRLTLSNFMKVLGEKAIADPSRMEAEVAAQVQARKMKHEQMNAERKLTKEQQRAKRAKKLQKDEDKSSNRGAVSIALFYVRDMSHRYHRTKVDLNAQQNNITGGVLECQQQQQQLLQSNSNPSSSQSSSSQSNAISLVICEGGEKAVKRFTRLMLVRMKWKGENFMIGAEDDQDDEPVVDMNGQHHDHLDQDDDKDHTATQKFNPNNTCELVWTGMAPKRMFNSFVFQSCATSEMARKVLEAKGVAHFWDRVVEHANKTGTDFRFHLGDGDRGATYGDQQDDFDGNDILMKDA